MGGGREQEGKARGKSRPPRSFLKVSAYAYSCGSSQQDADNQNFHDQIIGSLAHGSSNIGTPFNNLYRI